MVEVPSSSKFSARPTNKWSSNGCVSHTIAGLYYMMAASIGLFISMLWPLNTRKLGCLVHFHYFGLHVHRISPGSQLQYIFTFRTPSAKYNILYRSILTIKKFNGSGTQDAKSSGSHWFLYVLRPQTATGCCATIR